MADRDSMRAGVPVEIAAQVWRVIAPNPSMMTGPGTNTYVLGEKELAVLDPGPDDSSHFDALSRLGTVRWVLVTHTHRDHSPLAARLAATSGAQLIGLAPPADGMQDYSFRPAREPRDGELLQLGAVNCRAIHTPGHASNCVCYLIESARLLCTGDHILEGVSPVILPPDGDMSAYLSSLDKLLDLPFDRIAPGHGSVIQEGKNWIRHMRQHRLAREQKVLDRLAALGCASIPAMTPSVYDDVPPDRHEWAQRTLLAHLLKLRGDGRVVSDGDRWRVVPHHS
jgi:glyoxylase-like metal-dependent hydrolase (beta-lactamase superfamily II)